MSIVTPTRFGDHFAVGTRRLMSRFGVASLFAIMIWAAAPHRGMTTATQTEGGTIAGVVQDDSGAPVADVKVTISTADFSSSMLTQADGRFEFRRLKPGEYAITAVAARFRKERLTVTLARADETQTQVIKLVRASLRLTAFDATNQPLGGVSISLFSQSRGATASVAARTVTDESGDAYFGKLAPGFYQLTASLRGYEEYRSPVYISPDTTTDLPLQLLVAPVIPINEKSAARFNVPNLPSKNVQAIFQDSEGWMWFGTDKGIARFNGAEFKSSATSGSPYEKLGGEDVRSIAEDHGGTIWFATPRGVRRIGKYGDDRGSVIEGVDARHIQVDSRGLVWIATSTGLFMFDGGKYGAFNRSHGLQSDDVKATAEDKSGRIWIASARGVAVFDHDVITPFDRRIQPAFAAPQATVSRQRSPSHTPARPNAPDSRVTDARAVFVDRSGSVWFATGKGVLVFKDDRLTSVTVGALSNTSAAPSAISSVAGITEDESGRMWFGLESGGAVIYDPARDESQRVGYLDRDRVLGVVAGGEGMMWFATDNGAVRSELYSFVNFTAGRGLADNDVRAVVEAPGDAGLWFVTAAGVSIMENERFVPVERFRANFDVRAAAFDRTGAAWLATDQGVFELSGRTLTQLNEGNGLPSNSINWVAAISGGSEVLFASTRGASLFRGGEVRQIGALAGYDIRHVFEGEDGRLWFSTSRGIVTFDPRSGKADLVDTARGLADNDVRWIARFNSRLIVATRAGVQVYDEAATSSPFSALDGQPASTLFADRDRFLWIGTDDGQVKKFGVVAGHLVSVVYAGEAFGLTTNRINSISEDKQGRIWIATDKGAVRHIPLRRGPPARVWIELAAGVEAGPTADARDVPYGRRNLTFHFAAATQSGQVRYFHRIKGESGAEPWQMLPVQLGAERDVSVFELDEGARTFEVIALNRDLYGGDAPAAAFALRVGAPFWKRWWFYALVATLAGLGGAVAFVVRRRRAREFVLPRELRSYVPIEPNPYIVGNPIRTERMFFGREDDFRYVRTKLEGASQGVVIVFCGERRVGKSSILYQVLNGRLGERFIPVFVDMQEMVISSDSEFFARTSRLIGDAVTRALGPSSDPVSAVEATTTGIGLAGRADSHTARSRAEVPALAPVVSVPQFDGRNPYPVFLDFLDEVLKEIGDRTLLILMDEYELMESKVDGGKLSTEFFTFLAGLMDNKERLALIFTGSRRLEERDKKYWRELLRRSLFRKVGFLSQKDAVRLITEPLEGRAVFGRGVVDAVYRLTAGQPFYTQVICQNIVDAMNEHKQNWVTRADLEKVIADIVDNPLPQMIYTWDALSDDEKLVLSLLAEILPDGVAHSTAHELRTTVRANEYPVNLSENTIRLTLEEMFRRELLDKDSGEGFSFKMDLFRLWIRRSHSIWQVVKEVRTL
ncbi:MAG TPA: two-component regulator propeller domain-containing protein [Blastocatellia bacterium]|nr:two-component regulator propeller domain-containing protein [Blastocatellia bacterium]